MIRLSKSQILLLHEQLITETRGSSGLRNEGMLDSEIYNKLNDMLKQEWDMIKERYNMKG